MILIDDRIQEYTAEEIARWMDELPQWRREKTLAIKHDTGRRQSLLAYRLLCQGLREQYDITEPPTFVYGEHGKPYIIKNEKLKNEATPYFSLSHCREAVACIIDSRPVGIDIEATDRKVSDGLVRYAMNEEEQAEIARSTDRERAFFRLWTRKEAVAKLLGTGIQGDRIKDLLHSDRYRIETHEAERYVVSVAQFRT